MLSGNWPYRFAEVQIPANRGFSQSEPVPARRGLRTGRGTELAKTREDVLPVGGEECVLLGTDLVDVQLVKARVGVGLDRLNVLVHIGPAGDLPAEHLPGDQVGGLLEVLGRGKHLRQLSG